MISSEPIAYPISQSGDARPLAEGAQHYEILVVVQQTCGGFAAKFIVGFVDNKHNAGVQGSPGHLVRASRLPVGLLGEAMNSNLRAGAFDLSHPLWRRCPAPNRHDVRPVSSSASEILSAELVHSERRRTIDHRFPRRDKQLRQQLDDFIAT